MSKDDLFEKATKIVNEGDPEYFTLMADRVHKTVSLTATQAAANPKAIRKAASDLIDTYYNVRDKLPFETEEERSMAGPAIIAEMISILSISWAAGSLARSVGDGLVAKSTIDDDRTRDSTIETLSYVNFAIYATLIKHCIGGISKNKLHMKELYEYFLPPEMREKAN
jgi:hypothetical protein